MVFQMILEWIKRNPFIVLLLLFLAVGAPALFTGIAIVLLGLLAAGVVLSLVLAWKFRRLHKQMEEQFRQTSNSGGTYRHTGTGRTTQNEGEVHIYTTSEIPEKRVADNVGDYVDFEETKES